MYSYLIRFGGQGNLLFYYSVTIVISLICETVVVVTWLQRVYKNILIEQSFVIPVVSIQVLSLTLVLTICNKKFIKYHAGAHKRRLWAPENTTQLFTLSVQCYNAATNTVDKYKARSSGGSRNFQRGFQVQEVFNNPRLRHPAGVNVN